MGCVGFILAVKDMYRTIQLSLLYQRITILFHTVLKALNYDAVAGDPTANSICSEIDDMMKMIHKI